VFLFLHFILNIDGKSLGDEVKINTLTLKTKDNRSVLYLKDLGAQIGWKAVFFWEYLGPFLCYLFLYLRPTFIYGIKASKPMHPVVQYVDQYS
jgi:hypothetical protein